MLPKLNFPEYSFRFREVKNKPQIFDPLRKKFVELSPEEWVRQHLIKFLIFDKAYPEGLITIEKGVNVNSTQKRTDVLVFDLQKNPFLLIECKAPSEKLNKKVLEQGLRYNLVHNAPFILISNGLNHLCWDLNKKTSCELPDFPANSAKQ